MVRFRMRSMNFPSLKNFMWSNFHAFWASSKISRSRTVKLYSITPWLFWEAEWAMQILTAIGIFLFCSQEVGSNMVNIYTLPVMENIPFPYVISTSPCYRILGLRLIHLIPLAAPLLALPKLPKIFKDGTRCKDLRDYLIFLSGIFANKSILQTNWIRWRGSSVYQ